MSAPIPIRRRTPVERIAIAWGLLEGHAEELLSGVPRAALPEVLGAWRAMQMAVEELGGPAGWTECAVVDEGWSLAADGPPLWGWGTREEAEMLLRSLPTLGGGWHIVERDVTVSTPRPLKDQR